MTALNRLVEDVLQWIARSLRLCGLLCRLLRLSVSRLLLRRFAFRWRRCRRGGLPAKERIAQAAERIVFTLTAQDIAQLVLHDFFDRNTELNTRPRPGDAERNA